MSISNEIRAALKEAPGPISAKDVREALDDRFTAVQVSGALFALSKTGEVIREQTIDGGTYLLDSSYKPKRVPKEKPSPAKVSKPGKRKEQSLSTVVATLRHTAPAPTPVSPSTIKPATPDASIMPRTTMRQLAMAVVALHPSPMTNELKEAVLFAMHASL